MHVKQIEAKHQQRNTPSASRSAGNAASASSCTAGPLPGADYTLCSLDHIPGCIATWGWWLRCDCNHSSHRCHHPTAWQDQLGSYWCTGATFLCGKLALQSLVQGGPHGRGGHDSLLSMFQMALWTMYYRRVRHEGTQWWICILCRSLPSALSAFSVTLVQMRDKMSQSLETNSALMKPLSPAVSLHCHAQCKVGRTGEGAWFTALNVSNGTMNNVLQMGPSWRTHSGGFAYHVVPCHQLCLPSVSHWYKCGTICDNYRRPTTPWWSQIYISVEIDVVKSQIISLSDEMTKVVNSKNSPKPTTTDQSGRNKSPTLLIGGSSV